MSRRLIWRRKHEDDYHALVECAVRSDHSSPADVYLTQLRAGARRDDPEFTPPQDEEQIYDFHHLLAKIEFIGQMGEPKEHSDIKSLGAGVWEFRHGRRRLSYWDTPGDGTFDPKPRVSDFQALPAGQFEITDPWWYPEMDSNLRLGCGWDKDGDLAPPAKVQEAQRIREEDVRYDIRPST